MPTINTISMQSLPESSQIFGFCYHVWYIFYRKLGTILYMPFQFWYLKCQFRHFKKASTILIRNGNIKVFLMYQADKSQKILAFANLKVLGMKASKGLAGFLFDAPPFGQSRYYATHSTGYVSTSLSTLADRPHVFTFLYSFFSSGPSILLTTVPS